MLTVRFACCCGCVTLCHEWPTSSAADVLVYCDNVVGWLHKLQCVL